MGNRNTILAIFIFVFVALSATFGGLAFVYKLEAESLEMRIAIEEQKKKDLDKIREYGVDNPDGSKTPSILAQIESAKQAVEKAKDLIDNPNTGVTARTKDIESSTSSLKEETSKANSDRQKAVQERKSTTESAVNELSTSYRDMVDSLKKLEKELAVHEKDLNREQSNLLQTMSSEHSKTESLKKDIQNIKEQLTILNGKLERMNERRKRLEALNPDGVVLSADPKTNVACVNLGSRQGVRPGMVFDIFEKMRDGRKIRKGKLRLRKVESQQSMAVIMAEHDIPKVCPQCGWETTDPTYLFCPYCLGGEDEKEREAQRLSEGSTKERVVSAEFLNPVKKGDFISSPFYLGRLKEKAFTFAIAGETINRSRQEISMFLKENGCTLLPAITLDTDFAIVGVGPSVDQDLEKARKMGVSVLREKDLFDFFGKQGYAADVLPSEDEPN